MERRRNGTRAGMLIWTPTPGYSSSPPSPDGSRLSWDEGGEEDFESQMDENGIIGLRESFGEVDEEEEIALEEEEDLLLDTGTPEPEEGPPPALEELGCHLSELLDSEPFSQRTGDDCPSPSNNDGDDSVALEDWSDDEDGQKLDEESPESLKIHRPQSDSSPVRERVKSMTNDETEEVKGHREPSFSVRGEMDLQYNCIESHGYNSNVRSNNITTSRSGRSTSGLLAGSQNCCDEEFILNERLHVSSSPLSSTNTPYAPVLPFVPQLSSEEQACNSGIEAAETSPELAHAESIAESHSTRFSCSPRTFQPVRFEEVKPQLGRSSRKKEDELERKVVGPFLTHHQPPIPSPRKISSALKESQQSSSPAQHTAKVQSSSSDSSPLSTPHHRRHRGHRPSKPSHTELKDVRKGQMSHPLPDFSKVEPKVRFPKSGYKPPRSRRPPRKRDSKPEAPLVYRSPADIVREVLLSSTEGLSDTAAPGDPQGSLNSTVPAEFRCALQASTLVQQLQEDYNRLLTKYAEAENTIDRLRLEAKVGMYSDPPKPSQPTLPGVLQEGSKVMMLSFPQAQRVELSANNVHSTQERIDSDPISSMSPVSLAAIQLTEALSNHVQRFQLQVEEFEEILKSGKLRPYEQRQGLSQLAQGQESLERAYLDARDQYQQLQKQTGVKSGHFDPDRELEGLIFSSGMRLEEMKERIEQSEQSRHMSDPGPNLPPHTTQLSVSLNDTEPQPESPVSSVNAEGMVGLEVSSVSEDSAGDREEDEEEILPSLLNPLQQKHQRVEKDFSSLMDHFQNFRELPKLLDRGPCEDTQDSLEFRDSPPQPARNDRIEDGQQWRTKDEGDSSKSVQPSPTADFLSCPSSHSHGCNSMETLPAAPLPATILLGQQDSEMRPASSRKPHSSLGESANLEERASKERDGVLRAAPQDGVITPETDSGFVGSESSRLTPAAHSPVQQRAALRVTRPSVTQEKSRIKPETVSVSGQLPRSLAHIQASPGHSGRGPGSTGRRGETERQTLPSPSTSSSPLRWPSGHLQPWPSSAQSLSGEEVRQGDQYTPPASQNGCYLRSPSPAMLYHHGDHLKAQSSVQLTNRHEALQSLQEEVDRLRERLEGSLRMTSPTSPVRAPPSILVDCRNHRPSHTSTPLQPTARSLEQRAASKRGPRENRRSEEEQEEEERRRTPKHIPRRRSASLPRFRPELHITTDSDLAESEPKPRTSRHILASPAAAHASRRARTEIRRSTEPHTSSQQRSISADSSEEGDDEAEGSRGPALLCVCCMARHGSRVSAPAPARNVSSPSRTHHYSRHCPQCGARVSLPEHQNSAQREKSVSSRHRDKGGVYLAAALPPPVMGSVHVVQCVPVCPSVLYYSSPVAPSSYPKPLYLSRSEDRGYRSGVRGHHRRSHSVDTQHPLKSSLSRAVAAASSMHDVSRRMARSLASGLQHTSPIAQSCTY
ncbi:microtubule organization protein AKNA [Colossoma macropomum]|uniref:microtubule organization protein AKNA n=1 Tax=Colossoma macropomum TaxID=42526 RepID=UPI001864E746|nr:microtubule organization protein AKNA [Colossoma macropomum]